MKGTLRRSTIEGGAWSLLILVAACMLSGDLISNGGYPAARTVSFAHQQPLEHSRSEPAEWPVYFTAFNGDGHPLFEGLTHEGLAVIGPTGYRVGRRGTEGPVPGFRASETVQVRFVGSRRSDTGTGTGRYGETEYYAGVGLKDSQRRLPNYRQVMFRSIYPGIDVAYHGHGSDLEYDFLVQPHADPDRIALAFPGHKATLMPDGTVRIASGKGAITEGRPVAYQDLKSGRREVAAQYEEDLGSGTIKLKLGDYDPTQLLVVDPRVMTFGSYLPGCCETTGGVVRIVGDAGGDTYVATAVASNTDVYKYGPNGQLLTSIILGGGYPDDIALDPAGDVFVAGEITSPIFPSTIPVTNPQDGFFAKFDPSGTVIYSEHMRGPTTVSGAESIASIGINRIVADSAGDLFFTANSSPSSSAWVTANAVQPTPKGSITSSEAIVGELDPTGVTLLYGSWLGGSGDEYVTSIMLDGSGHLYVAGWTTSTDFPVTSGSYLGGMNQGFITEFNINSWTVAYSRYFGGSSTAQIDDLVADGSGGIYVSGQIVSTDLPGTSGSFQSTPKSAATGYVSHLDGNGQVMASTYFGGSQHTEVTCLAVDGAGNVYLGGVTIAFDLPVTSDAVQDFNVATYGATDSGTSGFVAELDGALQHVNYGTYYGGDFTSPLGYMGLEFEQISTLYVDANSNLYAGGFTGAIDGPVTVPFTTGVPKSAIGWPYGFFSEFKTQSLMISVPTAFAPMITDTTFSAQLTAAGGTPPYTWSLMSGALPIDYTLSAAGVLSGRLPNITLNTSGSTQSQFEFVVGVTDSTGAVAAKYIYMPVDYPLTAVTSTLGDNVIVNTTFQQALNITGGREPFACNLAKGALPTNATLSYSSSQIACIVSGKPGSTGSYSFTLQITDVYGQQRDFGPYTIDVTTQPPPQPASKSGGGTLGGMELMLLLGVLFASSRRRSGRSRRVHAIPHPSKTPR